MLSGYQRKIVDFLINIIRDLPIEHFDATSLSRLSQHCTTNAENDKGRHQQIEHIRPTGAMRNR